MILKLILNNYGIYYENNNWCVELMRQSSTYSNQK